MAIRIKARAGESAEQMMRRFKKLCEKEGLTKDVKRRAYYEKPSERKQRALRKSIKRSQTPEMPMLKRGAKPAPGAKSGPAGARPAGRGGSGGGGFSGGPRGPRPQR